MTQFLFVLALIFLLFFGARFLGEARGAVRRALDRNGSGEADDGAVTDLRSCAQCGSYVPPDVTCKRRGCPIRAEQKRR